MSSNFDDYSNIQIGNETFDFSGGIVDADGRSPAEAVLKAVQRTNITAVMGSLERLVSESYKFIRLADDINDMKNYINDMRLCFVALTISGYIAMLIYAVVVLCSRRNGRRRRHLRNATTSGGPYDEEALGWGEKPVLAMSHQTGSVGGGGAGSGSGGRVVQGDKDTYHYRSSGRRTMQPFGRQRYNVTTALSDLSERQAGSEEVDATKANGPLETSPLTTESGVAAGGSEEMMAR